MKIVILVSYTYPYVGSGIGQVAIKQAEGLVRAGHEVVLVSAYVPPVKKRVFKKNGVLHLKLNSVNFLTSLHIPVPLFFLNSQVITYIKSADIVHSHDMLYPYSFQAARLARKFDKKFVLTQHVGFVQYPNKIINLLEWLVTQTIGKAVLEMSNQVIVVNEELVGYLKIKSHKVVTLINGVDTSLFQPANAEKRRGLREKYGLPIDKKIVLFVGRLVPKKGFEILFEARDEGYLILFVGGGQVPSYMNQDKNKALFLGILPQKNLSEIYQASDIFVLPSKGEGLPLSIQEAMASGLPIITSYNPGFSRYLDQISVKFVEPNSHLLKTAIKEVLADRILLRKMGHHSPSVTVGRVSWEKNVDDLISIYRGGLK